MRTKLRRSLLIATPVVAAFVLAVLVAFSAFSSTASASHSWSGYHWARTSNPFTVKLGDNVSSAWDSYLSTSSSDWTASSVLNTTIVAGGTTARRCRPTTGRVEVCNYTYGNNGWLGVAQVWVSGSHITQGTVKFNDTYFSQAKYNNSAERTHVACQEVGHTFGLDHQDTSGASLNTCMDYYQNTSSSDTKSTTPNQHDYDELVTIYSHLDSSSTLGSAVPGPSGKDLSAASEWGKQVSASRGGRDATYVRDFGNGQMMFTFVVWAK